MAPRITLTPEELKELSTAAWHTWETIGDDLLSVYEFKGLRRSEVIELVLDADRLTTFNPDLSPRIREYLSSTSYATLKRVFKTVFPDTHYGY